MSMNEKGRAVQHTEPFVHSSVYVNIDTEPVMDLANVELLMNMMKASSSSGCYLNACTSHLYHTLVLPTLICTDLICTTP